MKGKKNKKIIEYYEYLKSEKWKQKKQEFFSFLKASNLPMKCDICGNRKKLSVHHMTYENIFNEDIYDLQLLCHTCHSKGHHKFKPKPPKPYKKNGITIIPYMAKTF